MYVLHIILQILPISLDHCAGGLNSGYCLGNFCRSQNVEKDTLYTTNLVDLHGMVSDDEDTMMDLGPRIDNIKKIQEIKIPNSRSISLIQAVMMMIDL